MQVYFCGNLKSKVCFVMFCLLGKDVKSPQAVHHHSVRVLRQMIKQILQFHCFISVHSHELRIKTE